MPVIADPDGITAATLLNLAQFTDTRVLEVGCGKGRLTFGYPQHTHHVTAVDPIEADIRTANQNKPAHLDHQMTFFESSIEDFIQQTESGQFDIILYTFSL